MSDAFPITALLPDIAATLETHTRLVLEAPPGAGKTTQVPLALLDAAWLEGRRIVMLEPRRVAARAAATFMSRQLGDEVGGIVGYRIRFESKVSARTRIEVVTEGILTRMLQDDPTLEGIGALLFDEFHERHLPADLGLALALDVQASLREDLRIVVMSATLDGARLAAFLDAPRLSSAGRSFPVTVAHFAASRDEAVEQQTRRAVMHALATHPGDLLVFLPGQREIGRAQAALESALAAAAEPIDILQLHGELPIEQQARVLAPHPDGHRRVVLSTNVAESSVTLPGVRVVIDTGLAREARVDPNTGFQRLDVVAISQASADQRAGRAGRVAEGWTYRLWPQSQRLEPQRRPEITQADLAGLALELAAWGSDAVRFVDPPPAGALAAARDLLASLGALQHGRITARGTRMLQLGAHPRLAAMLLACTDPTERALACDIAALIESRDPLRGLDARSDALLHRWQVLAAFRANRIDGSMSRASLAAIDRSASQWRRRTRTDARPPAHIAAHALGDVLRHAFPDRIARQHADQPRRYLLSSGRSARLHDDSALFGEPWLVVDTVRMGAFDRNDALIQRAAPLDAARLERDAPERFITEDRVTWDDDVQGVVAFRERRFDAIVLDRRPVSKPDASRTREALLEHVRTRGLDVLPWSESAIEWRARVQCLQAWMPEATWPDVTDAALLASLESWLGPALGRIARLSALEEHTLADGLKSCADWPQRHAIDVHAPMRITVPSGIERRIVYAFDAHADTPVAPVLAVKLQELFGLGDTPRIAGGRVPLTLHLLSPGARPLQVTQDLRSFWTNTYPEVRKEMKGRYPKHPWPEDPWSAVATHRAKPRGT